MRISDWSSDVCSSDLVGEHVVDAALDHASNRRRRAAHSRTDTRADLESAGQYLSHAGWPLRLAVHAAIAALLAGILQGRGAGRARTRSALCNSHRDRTSVV